MPATPLTDEEFRAFSLANEPYRFEKNANGALNLVLQATCAPTIAKKMAEWMRNGAQLACFIDRKRKVVIIYHSGQQPERLHKPDALEGEGPIAGFRLEMGRFWA